jgi:hypothetical protein
MNIKYRIELGRVRRNAANDRPGNHTAIFFRQWEGEYGVVADVGKHIRPFLPEPAVSLISFPPCSLPGLVDRVRPFVALFLITQVCHIGLERPVGLASIPDLTTCTTECKRGKISRWRSK